MKRQLTALIEREGDGYVSICPELDIASQGDTVESAKDASIALFKTKLSAFECCGKLYNLLKND